MIIEMGCVLEQLVYVKFTEFDLHITFENNFVSGVEFLKKGTKLSEETIN